MPNVTHASMIYFLFSVNELRKVFELKLEGKGKVGDLTVVFNGVEVNMKNFPKKTAAGG